MTSLHPNNRTTRRGFLKTALSALPALLAQPAAASRASSTPGQPDLDTLLAYLAPYPWKQEIVRAEVAAASAMQQTSPLISTLYSALSTSATYQDEDRHFIAHLGAWPIGNGPNYTCSSDSAGRRRVWAACFYSGMVSELDCDTGQVRHLPTGSGTNPLDVAFDEKRQRIVVASADLAAHAIILDHNGAIITSLPLAELTGQGESHGGIQGVAIDANHDYWFALAYSGQRERGVLVQVSGQSLRPVRVVRRTGIHNPNGLITAPDGRTLFAFSDNGYAHQFDLEGRVLYLYRTVGVGYRGAVSADGRYLWCCGWRIPGRMARIDLTDGTRLEFPCVDLANSIQFDHNGNVWVAGDAGISVSTASGTLLAVATVGAFTNGLSRLQNDLFYVSYDARLNRARLLQDRLYVPTVGV